MGKGDKTAIRYYGQITQTPCETVGRTESWQDTRSCELVVYGKFDDLDGVVKPGDSMASHSAWLDGWGSNWYVKTVSLQKEDGCVGALRMSLVLCKDGKTKPYNITWSVSMDAVQKSLITHPLFKGTEEGKVKARNEIFQWEYTQASRRMNINSQTHQNTYTYDVYIAQTRTVEERLVTTDEAKAYCKASIAGITSYNVYLPVISKVSQYLELPGVNYDSEDHQVRSGTISEFTTSAQIGNFDDNMDLKVFGFTDTSKGKWFKSADSYNQNSDGSWTRNEQWTYTNDLEHDWIYTGVLK